MAETIEVAKTGRSRCRICRQPIEKGSLRFGEEQPSAFADGMQWVWHHLLCAAKKKPVAVRGALGSFEGEVPGRAELDAALAEGDRVPTVMPYAEHASTARSHCQQCREPIGKGALRIAVERDAEAATMPGANKGYLHPRCAREYTQRDDLMAALRANSRGLGDGDWSELEASVAH
jgi:hypothetical protein